MSKTKWLVFPINYQLPPGFMRVACEECFLTLFCVCCHFAFPTLLINARDNFFICKDFDDNLFHGSDQHYSPFICILAYRFAGISHSHLGNVWPFAIADPIQPLIRHALHGVCYARGPLDSTRSPLYKHLLLQLSSHSLKLF